MYEALYRKYRPRTFDDVVGQEHITETLRQQVITGRLSHAYLFVGTRGTGKTTCARILAKAVNCEHPVNGNPCLCCESCLAMENGELMDVTELDAASNNGVDDVRMLRDEAVFSPTRAKKRVYIIDEVHMLSKPAFNALLKILEEPPEHLMFILATTELNKVLPTILSRCQRHSFRRLDAETVSARLLHVAEQEGLELTEDAALLLGRLADGGMRDGLSLLDQCASKAHIDRDTVLSAMGLMGASFTAELAELLAARNCEEALLFFRRMWQEGKDPATLLGELASFFRDALMLRLAPRGGGELLSGLYDAPALRAVRNSEGELLNSLNIIEKYLSGLRDAANPRLQAELCLIELCGIEASRTVYIPRSDETPAPARPAAPARKQTKAPAAPAERTPEPEPVSPPPEEMPPWEEEPPYVPPVDEYEEVEPPYVPPVEEYEDEEPPYVAPVDEYEEDEPPYMAPPDEYPEEPPYVPAEEKGSAAAHMDWRSIVNALGESVDVGTRMLFSDDFAVSGHWEGDELIMEVMPGFYMNMLNRPEVLEALSRACGAPVRCRELRSPAEIRQEKLDALRKFDNVTFR